MLRADSGSTQEQTAGGKVHGARETGGRVKEF